MNGLRILEWINGECFAVVGEDRRIFSFLRSINYPVFTVTMETNNTIAICNLENKSFFSVEGEWKNLTYGSILSITEGGKVNVIYKSDQTEVDLFVTNKCNSNCIMCPLSEGVRRRSNGNQKEWLMDYIKLLPLDIPYVNITGGEPTLEKDTFLDLTYLLKTKFQHTEFQLLTNGRSLSDYTFLKKVVENLPNHTRFAIPVHSSNPEIHDMITQVPGSFFQTDQGIKNLLSKSQTVEIRIVLSKLNIDTVYETVEYIYKMYKGVFVVNFIGMEMMGNAAINRDLLWEEYSYFFQKIKRSIVYLVSKGVDTRLYNFPLCAVEKGFWSIVSKSITDYKIRYKDACSNCIVKEYCGGFFFSTLKLMNPEVKEIIEI